MILIIDNQNAFIQKFKREFLEPYDIEHVFFDHNQPIILPKEARVKGVILSGGRGHPYKPLNLTANFVALMNYDVPVMGFCLGHEILAVAYLGQIKRLADFHSKKECIRILHSDDPIFEGLKEKEIKLQKRHHYCVTKLPECFICLAESETCRYEIIKHKDKPIYGFQGHPEVSGTQGLIIVKNFLEMCGM